MQESGSAYTIAGVNDILCNRLAILAPNSCVGACLLCQDLSLVSDSGACVSGSLLCRTQPLASGPVSCVRLCLLAQALPLGEFGVEEDEAGVAALLDLAYDGVNRGFFLDLLPYEAPEEVLGGLVFLGGGDIHEIVD